MKSLSKRKIAPGEEMSESEKMSDPGCGFQLAVEFMFGAAKQTKLLLKAIAIKAP